MFSRSSSDNLPSRIKRTCSFDQAITSFKDVLALNSEDAPADGVLMQLARAYRLAGKADDAKKTFKRVAEEFPQSPYAAAARREMEPS